MRLIGKSHHRRANRRDKNRSARKDVRIMKRSGRGLLYVIIGIAAANAALAGFFVAREGFEAAIVFGIMTIAMVIFALTGMARQPDQTACK